MKIALSGYFGFVLASCGQGDFGLRDISSSNFAIPESMFHSEKKECFQGVEYVYMPELLGGGALLFTDPAEIKTGQLHLRVLKDGTFTARYREFDFYNQTYEQTIVGNYTLDSKTRKIAFENLGEAIIYPFRGRYRLTLTFKHNYNSPMLLGQTLDMRIYNISLVPMITASCQ